MRKTVVNILFSILSVGLAVFLFFIGVFAATEATTITNTFYFSVDQNDLFVNIVGEVSGYANDITVPNYVHNYEDAEESQFLDWEVPPLTFAEENGQVKNIVFTFTIENHDPSKRISIEIEDYETNPTSTKIVNIPSEKIYLEPFNEQTQIFDYDIITVNVKVLDISEDFSVENSFSILIKNVQE